MLNFQNKGRKKLREQKHPFVFYNPHKTDITKRDWSQDNEWIVVSIDPGLVHLGFRIEARPQKGGEVRTLVALKQDIYAHYEVQQDEWVNQSVNVVYDIFDNYKALISQCHIFVIERQLAANYKAVSISKFIIAWSMIHLKDQPRLPLIIELDSKQKYRMFDAPPLNEKAIKKWGVSKAIEILQSRGDFQTVEFIMNESTSKRDDLADTVLISEALFKYMGWIITNIKVRLVATNQSINAQINIQGSGQWTSQTNQRYTFPTQSTGAVKIIKVGQNPRHQTRAKTYALEQK